MKKLGVGVAALLGVVAVLFVLTPRQKQQAAQMRDFDGFMNAMLEQAAIPGAAIAVIRDGEIVHLKGYGFADVKSGRAMTADTPINIASISKPVLGVALLQLKEQGLLDLDNDINDYLDIKIDNPFVEDETVTVRNLATHTSGIGDYYDPADYTENSDSPIALADYLADLLTPAGSRYGDGAHYLKTAPGAAREYSNLGAGVAGAVVERITGEHLADVQRASLFEPLDMKNTSWRIADFAPNGLAVRHEVRQCIPYTPLCANARQPISNYLIGRIFNPPHAFKQFEAYPQFGNPNYPDGGVHSSARDLAAFSLAILNDGRVDDYEMLKPETFEEMLRLQLPAEISTRQRFFWRDRNGLTGHAGSDLGVYSALYFDRETSNAYVVLMNRTPDGSTEKAMSSIVDRISASFF